MLRYVIVRDPDVIDSAPDVIAALIAGRSALVKLSDIQDPM